MNNRPPNTATPAEPPTGPRPSLRDLGPPSPRVLRLPSGPRLPFGSRLPSLRVTAGLAAGMLALGVGIGAAIGPAPDASFAGSEVSKLIPTLAAIAAGSAHRGAASAT
ncbi:MAG TPA: hypothetical protein VMG62_02500, partial [Solirubrobacteraceae bacterium]|nr:hypothetical protein [Solirubrobacteraceae bacterium]